MKTEVIDGPAAVFSKHAAGMRVVHHHDAPELVGHVAELRKRADVAVHAEHAVGDDERAAIARQCRDDCARGHGIAVREHLDGGSTQACAIDDARVVQLV